MSLLSRLLRQFESVRRLETEKARLAAAHAHLAAEQARLEAENARLAASIPSRQFVPPGHFYSPLPSPEEIEHVFTKSTFGPPFPAIDLNEAGQLARMERFADYYRQQPFSEKPAPGRRFYLENPSYAHYDAIVLYCMLREAQPRQVIEVGSGFSSAAMLDLDEQVFGGALRFTFIDPDMSRLRPLLRPDDHRRAMLIERRVQEVPLETFAALGANDVLFIDSSHVSKVGSDVNRLFFEVFPVLAPGVLIHLHDITGTLEYPRQWHEEGRAWNEQYLLRAFLMYNPSFRIELLTGWIFNTRRDWLEAHMPLCAGGGGGQIWLRKLAK